MIDQQTPTFPFSLPNPPNLAMSLSIRARTNYSSDGPWNTLVYSRVNDYIMAYPGKDGPVCKSMHRGVKKHGAVVFEELVAYGTEQPTTFTSEIVFQKYQDARDVIGVGVCLFKTSDGCVLEIHCWPNTCDLGLLIPSCDLFDPIMPEDLHKEVVALAKRFEKKSLESLLFDGDHIPLDDLLIFN